MSDSPVIPVTVTPIPLTERTYRTLLAALRVMEEEYGKSTDYEDAARYVHYRRLVEQAEKEGSK